MSKTTIDWLCAAAFLACFLLAQWYVSDVPQHRVITMTQADFDRRIAAERIDAAKKTMEVVNRCDRLQDQFRPVPNKGLM